MFFLRKGDFLLLDAGFLGLVVFFFFPVDRVGDFFLLRLTRGN